MSTHTTNFVTQMSTSSTSSSKIILLDLTENYLYKKSNNKKRRRKKKKHIWKKVSKKNLTNHTKVFRFQSPTSVSSTLDEQHVKESVYSFWRQTTIQNPRPSVLEQSELLQLRQPLFKQHHK